MTDTITGPGLRAGKTVPLLLRFDGAERTAAFSWVGAADFPRLEQGRAHILHTSEQAVFADLPAEKRRRSYLLGRHAAKSALAPLLRHPPAPAIEIRRGAFDQPVVHYPAQQPVEVSISHSETMACAVAYPAGFPMALDVEEIDGERAKTMKTLISAEELDQAIALTGSETASCALVWTAKEALSKALKCGMTVPFELLTVDRLVREAAAVTGCYVNFGQYKFHSWVRPGFVLSLVLPLRSELVTDLALHFEA